MEPVTTTSEFVDRTGGLTSLHRANAMISAADILKAKILIVDDQASYVTLLEKILRDAGYTAVAYTMDSREVYELHRLNRYDLILLDLQMPGLDGFKVMESLNVIETGGYLPVLVISGRSEHKLRALKAGARDFLSKPFDPDEVLIRVHNMIEVRLLQQKLLHHNSARLENSQRLAGIGDWEYDFVNLRLVWSEEIYRILGVTPQDHPPHSDSFYRRVHPDDLAFVHREKKAAAEGSCRVNFEHRIIRPDGEVRHVHQIAEMTYDERGQAVLESGTIQDITDRVRSEQALRSKEAQFNILTSTVPDRIYFKDRESRFLLINDRMARDVGLQDAAAAVGKTDSDFFSDEHARQARADEQKIMETGVPMIAFEEKETWPDGRSTWVSSTKLPVRDADGKITGLVGISRDITAHKHLEEQLRRAQRLEAIGSLASGVAHDMNNILAPMLMAAGILKEKLPAASDRRILDLVENGAIRGAQIIRQLLAFCSGVEGTRAHVQLRHLLREMEHLMQETFPRNIRIEGTIPGDLWTVLADATQIHQVLMNLCVNARDAMPEGGKLRMSAENIQVDETLAQLYAGAKSGPHVMVTVADNGIGIPPEIFPRIFDPFFTTKGVGKGTGLGLSTVIGIVKSHGGFITVYSEPGRGTSFKVFLRATGGMELDKREHSTAPIPLGNGELILVVDDEAPILQATCEILTTHKYRVLMAGSGEEAIKLFVERGEFIDLVLTDIMMPGVGGLELTRALRIIKPDLKVIATSGLDEEDTRRAFAALNVTEVLAKPCVGAVLLKAVGQMLAAKT
jgi:PAS domain S-box-containing protein